MIQNDKVFIGIDVSKATLDISLSGKHFKIKNEKKEILFFINKELFSKNFKPTLVCLESTGGHERITIQTFNEVEIPIHKAHPTKVYAFGKALNHFAKTDKLDAKLLEKYAAFVAHEEEGDIPLSKEFYELQDLRSIDCILIDAIQANKCRLKMLTGNAFKYLEKQIVFLKEQLKMVRKDIEKIIKSDDQLNQKHLLLVSLKGIGNLTANALIADLPELGQLTNKEISSLVGVAPKTHESGIKSRQRHIIGGRFYIRKTLYMAALVASVHNEKMKFFYQRLIAAGKASKVALTAVIRKIVVCLNAMLRNNQVYNAI